MCSDRCKNHGCRQKIPEGTSSAMFEVRTIAKCCEFKRCMTRFNVTRVTQVTVLQYTQVFFLGKCVQTAAKTMVACGQINQKALALLDLASGMLRNAVNSVVVPTEFAAELTTKMNSSKANS